MAFPTQNIPTTNLSDGTGDPSQARADLLLAVQQLNNITQGKNQADGVVVLTGQTTIPQNLMPSSITLPAGKGVQIINPGDGVVNIRDYLRLQPLFKVDVQAFTDMALGDMCLIQDAGPADDEPVLAFYTGTKWVYMALSGMTDL